MTKEQTKEAIKAMQAYVDGKTIKWAAFNSADEVMEAIKVHGDWVKCRMSGRYMKVVEVSECTIWAGCYATRETTQGYLYDEAFAELTFADGTPFGKLEE